MDEPPGLPAGLVGAAVRREWGVRVTHAHHAELGTGAWHWVLGDDDGPQWFATVDAVGTAAERRLLLAAYEAAVQLTQGLSFVVAPVRTRDARVAVDVAPGRLLSLTPYVEGAAGDGPFALDAERVPMAGMLGGLHSQVYPRRLPVWTPQVGRHARVQRSGLERCLELDHWSGGPWSVPAGALLADVQSVVEGALRRFALLGAAVAGTIDRWVVTHGEPNAANMVDSPDGPRLVDWASIRLAPRERDLRETLGESDGNEPWFAYVEAGGRPDPISPDTLELFALEWHLTQIAEHAVLFSRPHEQTADTSRCFTDLESELTLLVDGWS